MIESLESRIAPAAVFKFTDVDGDLVTVKTTKGTNELLENICTLTPVTPGSAPSHLDKIDFTSTMDASSAFAGTDLAVTVKKKPGGDGRVEVGGILARNSGSPLDIDLGKVSVKGDLGYVTAGDSDLNTTALRSLSAGSLTDPLTTSSIRGSAGSVKFRQDVRGVLSADGTIDRVFVGGDLAGVEGIMQSGTIGAAGIHTVLINGNIVGAPTTQETGRLFAGEIDTVTIRGSVMSGGGITTGLVNTVGGRKIVIGGDILGGVAGGSGVVRFQNCALVTVGGDISGGASDTGTLLGTADSTPVEIRIGGNVAAGEGPRSGVVQVEGTIEKLVIKGNVNGGNQIATQMSGLVGATQIDRIVLGGKLIGGGRILTLVETV